MRQVPPRRFLRRREEYRFWREEGFPRWFAVAACLPGMRIRFVD